MNRRNYFRTMLPVVFSFALLFSILCMNVKGYAMGGDADENGTYETATVLQMKKTVKDSLSAQDDVDIFKIEVEKNNNVMFVFTASFRSPYFTIEDDSHSYITSQYVNGSSNEPAEYKCIRNMTAGTYYIKVTAGKSGGDYSVYVTDQQPSSISISQTTLSLEDNSNSSAQLKAEVVPKDSVEPEIEWKSSDVFVARVDKGLVKANGLGYTVVTAEASGYPNLKASCSVTVRPRQVANVNQNTTDTKKNKIALTCTMGYTSAQMPDGYKFYLYDKSSGKYVCKGTNTKNEFTFKGLKAETGYKIRVSAYINTPAGEVEGAMSDEKTLYTAPKQLKGAKITGIKKKNLTMYQGYRARIFNLKWKKVKGATSYKIYGQSQSGAKFTLMATTKKTNADMYAGIGYKYKVYVVPVRTKHGVSTDGKKSPKYTVNMKE